MRNIKRIALLLSLVLLASMTGCARKSRRPALPAAPLQASLTAESADTGETASTDEMAPMMKSAAVSASRTVVMEEPVETLLEQFAEPLENEGALYQDYVQAHRSAYVKLRQRPEEVLPLILPELLSDRKALECYSDDTSRTTLLYCLFKDILQGEPFSWDGDSYRYLSDMLAEFIQFVSEHELKDSSWFEENAPLTGLCAASMKTKPSLRLNMTACEGMSNAQALTNAKRVFAAALEGRDEDTYGFAPWPDGIENGFDFTTTWTLSQAETDDVTLTAVDPDTGETVSLRYLSNEAERESILNGFGTLLWTKADGETEELPSENAHLCASCVRGRDTPVQDGEFVLENGVETGMDYNTVLLLIGKPNQVWSDTMAGVGMEASGMMYVFHYDDQLVWRLRGINFRFAEDTSTGVTSTLPAAREIALGDTMQSVFDKLPDGDKTLGRVREPPVRGRQLLCARYRLSRRSCSQRHICKNRPNRQVDGFVLNQQKAAAFPIITEETVSPRRQSLLSRNRVLTSG